MSTITKMFMAVISFFTACESSYRDFTQSTDLSTTAYNDTVAIQESRIPESVINFVELLSGTAAK